jgi:SAM-dependent methyltransferase
MTGDPGPPPRPASSLPASYFDAIYESDPDPWRFQTSAYERAKYGVTLAALPRPRYRRALEVGCSIGVLSRDLAPRCDALLSVDAAEKALAAARAACADRPNVEFALARVPDEWPDGAAAFDLILLSEVVYYFDRADVARLADRVRGALAPGGDCLLVHWTGDTDYPLSGDDAAECFIAAASPFAAVTRRERAERYRLDLLRARTEAGAQPTG